MESELKLFGLYSFEELSVSDDSLSKYINISKACIVPHSAAPKDTLGRFGQKNMFLLERIINNIMRKGRNTGKKAMVIKMVRDAFSIIHKKTGKNPMQVTIDAVINCAPREDVARVGRGSNMSRKSVDVSPYRSVCESIKFIVLAAQKTAFRNKKTFADVLAEVLTSAANKSQNSVAYKKKEETERIAMSNR